MNIEVSFPGGVAVDATFHGHTVRTDQPQPLGGNTAMSPFDLFLASIATCMGFYALRFCQERGLATVGLGLTLAPIRDPSTGRTATIRVTVRTPEGFPAKYENAFHRSIDHCAVKKHVMEPPQFEIEVTPAVGSAV